MSAIQDAIHAAICEDSIAECNEQGGACVRAAGVIRAFGLPTDLVIYNGWLAALSRGCSCAGGTIESSYHHENGCGLDPIIELSKLPGWPVVEGGDVS